MKFPISTSLVLAFVIVGCSSSPEWSPTSVSTENSRTADDGSTVEANAVLSLYVEAVVGSGANLTTGVSEDQAKAFKKHHRRRTRDALGAKNLHKLFEAANKTAIGAAGDAGIEVTPVLEANLNSVALVFGNFENITGVLGEGLRENMTIAEYQEFLGHVMPNILEGHADQFAEAALAAADKLGLPPEQVLEAVIKNTPKGSEKYLADIAAGIVSVVNTRNISDDAIATLVSTFDSTEAFEDSRDSLLKELRQEILEELTSGTTTGGVLDAISTLVNSAVAAATGTTTATATATGTAPALSYVSATLSLTTNVAMTSEDPATGTFTAGTSPSCSVSPALPTGLSLNATTCVISGTPTATSSSTEYTVTLMNSTGTATDTITIVVTPPAFSTSLDLTASANFHCDGGGAGSCASSANVTIGSGTAAVTASDRKIDSDAEWAAGTSTGTTSSSDVLTLNATRNDAGHMDASWAPQWANVLFYYDFEGDAENIKNPGTCDGTASGNAAANATGKVGQFAATFDGIDDYFDTGCGINLTTSDSLTIMAWVKTSDTGEQHVMAATDSSDDYIEFAFNSSNEFRPFLRGNSSGTVHTGSNGDFKHNGTYNDGNWHHLVMTWDASGSDPIGTLYQDGRQVLTDTFDAAKLGGTLEDIDLSGVDFFVGCRNNNGGGCANDFDGQIDELAVWTTALTAAEVEKVHRRQSVPYAGSHVSKVIDLGASEVVTTMSWDTDLPQGKSLTSAVDSSSDYSSRGGTLNTGLAGYYSFEDADTTSLKDSSGNSQNSEWTAGTLTKRRGIIGHAWEFGAGNLNVGNFETYSIGVSFWVYPNADFTSANKEVLVAEGRDDEWEIHYDNAGNNTIQLSYKRDCCGTWISDFTPSSAIPNNQWTHVVIMFDRDLDDGGGDYKIYLNGELDVQDTSHDGDTIKYDFSGEKTGIGAQWDGSKKFSGLIDEVGIWTRGLTAAEALELYQRGATQNHLQYRTCSDGTCSSNPAWVGPGGTFSFFSEVHNFSAISSGDPDLGSGLPNSTGPFKLFTNFAGNPAAAQYFQFKVVQESWDTSTACSSGSATCYASLNNLSINPRAGNVASGAEQLSYNSGSMINATAISYSSLTSIVIADSGTCTYQFSPDNGSTYYHHNGTIWTAVGSDSDAIANDNAALSAVSGFPAGTQLKIKAIMGDSGASCSITSIQVNGFE